MAESFHPGKGALETHGFGGGFHTSSTYSDVNGKVSDATLGTVPVPNSDLENFNINKRRPASGEEAIPLGGTFGVSVAELTDMGGQDVIPYTDPIYEGTVSIDPGTSYRQTADRGNPLHVMWTCTGSQNVTYVKKKIEQVNDGTASVTFENTDAGQTAQVEFAVFEYTG